jgi:hypothetical protein
VTDPVVPASVWKRVLAAILDFFTAFFFFGWLIGHFTGNTTEEGFNLKGGPAFLLFVLAGGLFFHWPALCRRYALGPHSADRPAAADNIGLGGSGELAHRLG